MCSSNSPMPRHHYRHLITVKRKRSTQTPCTQIGVENCEAWVILEFLRHLNTPSSDTHVRHKRTALCRAPVFPFIIGVPTTIRTIFCQRVYAVCMSVAFGAMHALRFIGLDKNEPMFGVFCVCGLMWWYSWWWCCTYTHIFTMCASTVPPDQKFYLFQCGILCVRYVDIRKITFIIISATMIRSCNDVQFQPSPFMVAFILRRNAHPSAEKNNYYQLPTYLIVCTLMGISWVN